MALQPGTHLGRYEIVSLVGSGGMGEVYRARDPRLDRTVAIKVLPAELVADPEFRRRLEREAKTISRLQHPNVCTLHDYDTAAGADFLVLEYLEGQTLEDRIGRGRIPVEEATRIGGEIAEAIAAAHRLGIVHRDLKPGNVMLTATGAKVLDFGLARGTEASGGSLDSEAATMQATITEEGRMVGTMPYMAPEQLHGGTVDARTDIWALGCILYEMVTGQRPFTGASRADLIAAILGAEPEPPARKPLTPRHVDRVVRRCLEKDPDRRWHSAKDVALELGAPLEEPEIAAASGPPRVPTILAAALALLTLAAGLALGFALFSGSGNGPGSAAAGERWTISTLDLEGPVGRLSLSPDGRSLVFARHSDDPALYFRALDSRTERRLAGTERADDYSSFSPDGRQLVISHRGGGLMTLAVEGGAATPLVDEPASEPSWERDGYIYYTPVLPAMWTSTESLQLWRTAASGGGARPGGPRQLATRMPRHPRRLTHPPPV
ncbi:MAG: protein kinase, partial [Thermoanaerobaculia bacterium]|nr:protein kinase [Thermoanaerobaculia bacterium]